MVPKMRGTVIMYSIGFQIAIKCRSLVSYDFLNIADRVIRQYAITRRVTRISR